MAKWWRSTTRGNPSFQRLPKHDRIRYQAAVKGVAAPFLNFFAFDLLYLNGYDLRKAALIDRASF